MVNPWHLEVHVLSAEEFHGPKGCSSQCKAHVLWLLLPALLGIPALAQTHYTAQSQGGSSSQKEAEMGFGSSRASSFPAAPAALLLLANSLSSCSRPRSPAQLHFFLLPHVPARSCSIILTQHLCQQPWSSPFPSRFRCPLPPALLGCGAGPVRGRAVGYGIQPSPTRSTFPRASSSASLCD